ncbi:MAG TPA: ABC transporter, partial [Clostridiales bacterium]|nr:ABC transporter [Clostridiales bacterium]
LGENGAGKSTTINIMCGMLAKDSGTVEISGINIDENLDEIKKKIGVVFQESVLDKALTVKDNLQTRASFYGIIGPRFEERLKELTEMFELKDILNRTLKTLSGGQKRRVDIARALVHNPEILILDEPTTGLDPHTRRRIWEVIYDLKGKKGLTVFLTTHYMEEAAEADYVLILEKGKISAQGTPLQLKNTYAKDYIMIYSENEQDIKKLNLPYEKVRNGFRLSVDNTAVATELIIKYPELFKNYEITKGKMDDVFLNVTGRKMKGE